MIQIRQQDAVPYGCQTARQYFCDAPGVIAFVMLSELLASVFVDCEVQEVKFVED